VTGIEDMLRIGMSLSGDKVSLYHSMKIGGFTTECITPGFRVQIMSPANSVVDLQKLTKIHVHICSSMLIKSILYSYAVVVWCY
jgi:hypothetical protein